jgi:hypothetical protein
LRVQEGCCADRFSDSRFWRGEGSRRAEGRVGRVFSRLLLLIRAAMTSLAASVAAGVVGSRTATAMSAVGPRSVSRSSPCFGSSHGAVI